ncbi:MAG: FG-GAP repeat protein, partial [Minicystis sp.]
MRRRSLALPLLLVTFAACADGAPARPASEPIAEARDALSAIQQAKLLAADGQASDSFGTGVALDGDTAIVGAYQKSGAAGAAYVFVRSGAAWSQQAKLVAADPSPGDCFGISVSVSGDTALIGAYGKLNGGQTAGAAYVFTRSGAVWSQQAKLVPADNAAGDAFGISTALDGDTALIGAMWKNQTRGAAYVFARSGVMWSQQAKLVAADGQPDDQLGNAVALSGNLALIGAFHAGPKAPGSGAAYAFQRQGDVWSLDAKLFPADGAATDFFGYALALSGTSALVGAPNNSQAGFDAGATYAFDRSTGSWSPQAKLLASNAAAVDNFGRAIAMNASSAVIGAPLVQSFTGAAYLFTRASGGAWIEGPEMSAAAGQSDDRFGEYVALSGASALIGAWGDDEKAMSAGAAYVFALEGLEGTGGGASSSSGGGAGGSMTT